MSDSPAPITLLPHQRRVVDEKVDLDVRLSSLNNFIDSPMYDTLPGDERQRLMAQSSLMAQLSNLLGARIAHFPPAAP